MDLIENIYPLSPMQQGMLFHSLYAPQSGAYVIQLTYTLEGDVHIEAFEHAWHTLVNRHAVLRTDFNWEDADEPVQIVYKHSDLPIIHHDWRSLSDDAQTTQLTDFLRSDREQGFDLSKAPLIRINLIRLSDTRYFFMETHHHVLLDGWCTPLLMGEFFQYYAAYAQNQTINLPQPRPYRDYIAWLQQQDLQAAEQFWRKRLAGFIAPTPLGTDLSSITTSAESVADYTELQASCDRAMTEQLQTLARQHQLTLNTLIQGAWAVLLSRYSGEQDIVFGATVSGRPANLAGVETMIGLFINTLPIRISVPLQQTWLEWLHTLQLEQAKLRQYEYSSLIDVQGWSEVPRGLPLFESIVVFENYPTQALDLAQDERLRVNNVRGFEQTNYPLTLLVAPREELSLRVMYDKRRFDTATIERLITHFQAILQQFVTYPQQPIGSVSLLDSQERDMLLHAWNDTAMDYPHLAAVEMIAQQAQKNPSQEAVVCGTERLNYQELQTRILILADHLATCGVNSETRVAIYLDRSVSMVVAMLAVHYLGAAYVPLDPAYPQERIEFMLADSQTEIIISESTLSLELTFQSNQVICVDTIDMSPEQVDSTPRMNVDLDYIAYVIYTSGSTGKPKGVQISQRALTNFLVAINQKINLSAADRMLAVTTLSFDIAALELLLPLSVGGTVVIAERETVIDGQLLADMLSSSQATVMQATPTTWRMLIESGWHNQQSLTILCGGEALPWVLAEALLEQTSHVWNVYGPTETTIWSTARQIKREDGQSLIGTPIGNTALYITDEQFELTPIGVAGELLIGGASLSIGYHARPSLTAERFIPHPWSTEPGARLYRTGDLVRYRSDGSIEYVGRLDYQVKIRGVRIELGEIETVLDSHPHIGENVVIAATGVSQAQVHDQRLIAYVVPQKNALLDRSEIMTLLRQKLPPMLVPASVVILEQLPRTSNGKIDRKRLPLPERESFVNDRQITGARTETEETLIEMWQQILGVSQIGINDNFFELGGHSLLATQLVSRLRNVFRVELPLRAIFDAPTVVDLSLYIQQALRSGQPKPDPIQPVSRDQALPLSYAQQRAWILDQLALGSAIYNHTLPIHIQGALDVDRLKQILAIIVKRHELLRTTYPLIDGQPIQKVHAPDAVDLPITDLSHVASSEQINVVQTYVETVQRRSFDLAHEIPFRLELLHFATNDHVLLITMHHIITDDWSTTILIKEMAALSEMVAHGDIDQLPSLPVQYADFAVWQRKWVHGPLGDVQLKYWQHQLNDLPATFDLPTDHPRRDAQDFQGATRTLTLPQDMVAQLQDLSVQEDATQFMLILAAFHTVLSRYSGQTDLTIGSLFNNRNRVEIEHLIGFFLNTLPLRIQASDRVTFQDFITMVREVVLGAYAHQDLPFELILERIGTNRTSFHAPLFQVGINFVNITMPSIDVPELSISNFDFATDEEHVDRLGLAAAQLDIMLTVRRAASNAMTLSMYYNTELFEKTTIDRLLSDLQYILLQMIEDPEQSIAAIDRVSTHEKQQLLNVWGVPADPAVSPTTLPSLFKAQVSRDPHALALVSDSQKWTYAEINAKVQHFVGYLQSLGVVPGTPIGLCAGRSSELIIGMLAILSAGAVYVPLDPSYPLERLTWIIEDTGIQTVLVQQAYVSILPQTDAKVVVLETIDVSVYSPQPVTLLPDQLAYIIYTSGSTGKPKGVPITHGSLTQILGWGQQTLALSSASRVLQTLSPAFDFGTFEILSTLISGAMLVLLSPEAQTDLLAYIDAVNTYKITLIHTTPAFFAAVAALDTPMPSLRTVHLGGEALPPALIEYAEKILTADCQIFNGYGPTEATINCSIYKVDRQQDTTLNTIPIGRATAHHRLYVLDAHGQLVPPGVVGELCVGGDGLSWGYWKRPGLTAERFLPDPYSSVPGSRYYRTGDRVRYRSDGQLEHLGRMDNQVKVRGFRIELGEVESALRRVEGVADAAAVIRTDPNGAAALCGFVAPSTQASLVSFDIQTALRTMLPAPMIPTEIIVLPSLPRTVNGKLDRDALRDLEQTVSQDHVYVQPSTTLEEMISDTWCSILDREYISVDDNFFTIGGHSLLATQVIHLLSQSLELTIPLRTLFEHPTIADLALAIEEILLDEIEQLSDEEADSLL